MLLPTTFQMLKILISEVIKIRKLFYTVSVIFLLTACGTTKNPTVDDTPYPTDATTTEGDFDYRLYTEQESYSEHTNPAVFAELTYIGEEESIDIYHAASPFYFPMKERARGFDIDYAMNEPLLMTTLKKDEPFRQKYSFAGGYSDNDEKDYVNFVQDLIDNGFPEGDYVIDGLADFYTKDPSEATVDEKFKLKATIGFTVKKAK